MTWRVRNGKYGNRIVEVDGETFHSQAEATEYFRLKQMLNMGMISKLERQVPFKLIGLGGTVIGIYKLDFTYVEGGMNIAHESKGKGDTAFELRVKLFKDNYPGWVFRITGAYQRIKDKSNAKARAKYAQKKLLDMVGEKA